MQRRRFRTGIGSMIGTIVKFLGFAAAIGFVATAFYSASQIPV